METHSSAALSALWAFVGIVFVLVGLRLYTRLHLMDRHGPDDYVYTASSVLLLIHTVFMQVSAMYGFGRNMDTLSDEDAAKAKMWEMVGLTVAFVTMAIAKWSMGLFLLRIIVKKYQRIAIWSMMISLLLSSFLISTLFWTQRLPPSSIFDQRIPGRRIFDIEIFVKFFGVWGVAADFLFAILPWIAFRSLNMGKRQKYTIAGSLSLGVIAAACGVTRNVQLGVLNSKNFTGATTTFVLWTAAEIFVTLVCTGIPVLWPLVHHWAPRLSTYSRSAYRKQSVGREGPGFALHTIGGSAIAPAILARADRGFPGAPSHLGIRGPVAITRIASHLGDGSEEEILPASNARGEALQQRNTIHVRDDFVVEYVRKSESSRSV